MYNSYSPFATNYIMSLKLEVVLVYTEVVSQRPYLKVGWGYMDRQPQHWSRLEWDSCKGLTVGMFVHIQIADRNHSSDFTSHNRCFNQATKEGSLCETNPVPGCIEC